VALIVIPARLASTRLPKKVLLKESGKFLMQHTWERARKARCAERVIIATDSEDVFDAARSFNAEVLMTDPAHTCGTERVAEVARKFPQFQTIINLQADEPETEPELLDTIAQEVEKGEGIVTAAAAVVDPALLTDPATVKVVCDNNSYALYFSRSEIPYERFYCEETVFLCHIGIYGFSRDALLKFVELERGKLERVEGLEQLRALENGMRIKVVRAVRYVRSIDTEEDYRAFLRRLRESGN